MRTALTMMTFFLWMGIHAQAQGWHQTNGPEGADVVAMAAGGATLLAAVEPGVIYRHDEHGWTRLAALRAQQLFYVDGIFMASTLDGIYRSSDRGENWQPIGPNGDIYKLAADGDVLYAAVDSTIYRLSEAGIAWTEMTTAPLYFFNFFVHDSTILISRGGSAAGVYRSLDGGWKWAKIKGGIPPQTPAQAFHMRGSTLYLSIDVHGIFRSTDGGINWKAMNDGLPKLSNAYPLISTFISVGGQIWAAGRDGTFSCIDSTWHVHSVGNDGTIAASRGIIYSGARSGVMVTADTGRAWHSLNPGLHALRINALATFGNAILAGAGGSIHRSMDQGISWSRITSIGVVRFARGGNAMYAFGQNFFTPGIFRTTDGLDWGEVGKDLPQQKRWISALAAQGDTIFVGYYRTAIDTQLVWLNGGVYRSTDRGATWSAANSGLPRGPQSDVPVLDLLAAGRVVLASTVDGLYRSPDGGGTWVRVNSLPDGTLPGGMAHIDGKIFLAGSNRVYMSTDGGVTWSFTGTGLPSDGSIHHISALRGTAFVSMAVGAHEARIFRLSEDRWVDITAGFPEEIRFLNFVETGNLVMAATTDRSVWIGRLDPASDVPWGPKAENAIEIVTAPNPFRSETTVDFTLKERADVRLTLISPLGQELAVVHRGVLDAGEHRLALDGASLAAGAYHLRLETGGSVWTTMVVKTR